jgi:hypothetical protein
MLSAICKLRCVVARLRQRGKHGEPLDIPRYTLALLPNRCVQSLFERGRRLKQRPMSAGHQSSDLGNSQRARSLHPPLIIISTTHSSMRERKKISCFAPYRRDIVMSIYTWLPCGNGQCFRSQYRSRWSYKTVVVVTHQPYHSI